MFHLTLLTASECTFEGHLIDFPARNTKPPNGPGGRYFITYLKLYLDFKGVKMGNLQGFPLTGLAVVLYNLFYMAKQKHRAIVRDMTTYLYCGKRLMHTMEGCGNITEESCPFCGYSVETHGIYEKEVREHRPT